MPIMATQGVKGTATRPASLSPLSKTVNELTMRLKSLNIENVPGCLDESGRRAI